MLPDPTNIDLATRWLMADGNEDTPVPTWWVKSYLRQWRPVKTRMVARRFAPQDVIRAWELFEAMYWTDDWEAADPKVVREWRQ